MLRRTAEVHPLALFGPPCRQEVGEEITLSYHASTIEFRCDSSQGLL